MIQLADLISMLRHMTEVLERQDQEHLIESGAVIVMSMTDPEQEKRGFLKVSYLLHSQDATDKLEEYINDLGCELVYDQASSEKLVYIAKTIGVKT